MVRRIAVTSITPRPRSRAGLRAAPVDIHYQHLGRPSLVAPRQTFQTRLCCGDMTGDMERALGALRDFTRRDILLRFYADRKPRSVEDVGREAGVHRSVAFEHLERLVALGYLEVAHRRGLPGKPAKIYKLTG